MKFRAILELAGKTATGIHVPDEVVEGLGSSRRPAVRVTIGEHSYRSTLALRGGRFLLPVSAENRTGAGIAAGDEVEIGLELDTELREVALPVDLAGALDGEAEATAFFAGLSPSKQKWFVTWVEAAKKAETRERRVADAVVALREGRSRA